MFLYNMDFAMEWPRPLPPNVQLVGALLPTQAKPLPPVFEVRMQHHSWLCIAALQLQSYHTFGHGLRLLLRTTFTVSYE